MKTFSPLDPNVTVFGRTVLREPLPLFWTASGVELITDASTLSFEVEAGFTRFEPWIRAELDGVTVLRRPLSPGRQSVPVFQGLERQPRRVRLYKETQPMPQDPSSCLTVHSIHCDGELFPNPPYSRRIEFIGDSVSSGEGLGGGFGLRSFASLVFSTENHYAVETARRLNADFRILSQSGWGVLSSWDNDRSHVMPRYYEQICGTVPGQTYVSLGAHRQHDFSTWQPDMIVVHLGYNDAFARDNPPRLDPETGRSFAQRRGKHSAQDEDTGRMFLQASSDFLKLLRRANPNAHLVWTHGVFGPQLERELQGAIAVYRNETGDEKVSYVPLPEAKPDELGSNDHPGAPAHLKTADALTDALSRLL